MQDTPRSPAILHAEPDGAAQGAPLDLHEGIWTPTGCPRWPEHLRLVNSDGEPTRGRCRATNLCTYCARLAAVENSEVLALDAMTTGGPRLYAVLTTRTADSDPSSFYLARKKVMLAVKRRWPDAEYAAVVEFTTGRAGRSGGLRRPHWNLLLKGVPAGEVDDVAAVIRRVWCARVDAQPAAQYVGLVEHAGGLMRYLALHFHKLDQSPPHGWRGHRFLKSRGYFAEPLPALRAQAREQLRFRRELWRLEQSAPIDLDAADVHDLATAIHERKSAQTWKLVQLHELAGGAGPVTTHHPVPGVTLRPPVREASP